MRFSTKTLALGMIFAATVATAHEHVSNPVVKERMDNMQVIRVNTGVMGDMMKGELPFDAAKAAEAKSNLAAAAAEIVKKFEANETDPATEAAPAIWENFADFSAKSEALVKAAEAVDVTSLDTMKATFRDVGASCKSCHELYRIEK